MSRHHLPPVLSSRECDVALLVADGLQNREIAARLGVSERTVDTHVCRILARLGFRNRVQVAAWVGCLVTLVKVTHDAWT